MERTKAREATVPCPAHDPDAGHRRRLRLRYARGGLARMLDDEALELLLTYAIPRRDVKPAARALLARFASLSQVLSAPREALAQVPGVGERTEVLLRLVRDLAERSLAERIAGRPILSDAEAVSSYLRVLLGHRDRECFTVLLLNSRNELLDARILFEGTVNETAVYPREILRAALAANATALILAHNHPGGTPRPSREDADLTRRVRLLAGEFGIRVHDHLVVTRTTCVSLRERDARLFG